MPLLRLDVGRLFAGLVGASEARTRETIQRAEAMAPCILWIDEIDKAFGGDGRSEERVKEYLQIFSLGCQRKLLLFFLSQLQMA